MVLSPEQRRFASWFPDVCWSLSDQVCILRPTGEFTSETAALLVGWLAEVEADIDEPFSRFTDLTQLETIDIARLDLANLAFWRRATYSGPVVKSALLATSEEGLALANDYKEFMNDSKIRVSVFNNISDAAAWLGVPAKSLELSRRETRIAEDDGTEIDPRKKPPGKR